MPEFRYERLQKRWVIIAPERQKRASDFIASPVAETIEVCPFCPGQEHQTPPEIFALRSENSEADKTGWKLRVFPNKYPALIPDVDDSKQSDDLILPGIGRHEVLVETPEHESDLADMSINAIADVLKTYKRRILAHRDDPRLKYTLIFKNQGHGSGATRAHPHTQIISTPIIPRTIETELESCREYYEKKSECLLCAMIRKEFKEKRVIFETESIIAYTPFASRLAYETFIVPLPHSHDYTKTVEPVFGTLAAALKFVLKGMREILGTFPYNLTLHTAPHEDNRNDQYPQSCMYYHWHIEILPRMSAVAGFEIGSGFFINTVAPEEAAENLREAIRYLLI